MKGVILCGGLGTRLEPLTNPLSKSLLPVHDRPMIVHAITTLVGAGISDIMLVLGAYHPGLFLEMLGEGEQFGCQLTYRYRRAARGPGQSLLMAESWVGEADFALMLGDGLYFAPLSLRDNPGPHMFVMPLDDFDDPQKYGQVTVRGSRVETIVWKPAKQYSNLIQTTCFTFPADVFERLHELIHGRDGEIPITALTSQYVNEGQMRYSVLPPCSYLDCGTIEALQRAGTMMSQQKALAAVS